MRRATPWWLAVIAALSVAVAYQVTASASDDRWFVAQADVPTVAPGADVLVGIELIPARVRGGDYRRAAFGDAWTDDNDAPGGHNGCDTRNDILNRDLVDKTFVSIKRCPGAVATGTLHDPYTNAMVAFVRGNQTGAAVQIEHIVSAAVTYRRRISAGESVDDMPLTVLGDMA